MATKLTAAQLRVAAERAYQYPPGKAYTMFHSTVCKQEVQAQKVLRYWPQLADDG